MTGTAPGAGGDACHAAVTRAAKPLKADSTHDKGIGPADAPQTASIMIRENHR
jgi:hypothetical protein